MTTRGYENSVAARDNNNINNYHHQQQQQQTTSNKQQQQQQQQQHKQTPQQTSYRPIIKEATCKIITTAEKSKQNIFLKCFR